ncbi:hypothetical protein ABH935_007667 [Catenulispora sp. GAS73]|uniref:hypothetical protein n=1 Tax=Catenulispora sp. GAS73 TaxID=3156269 RepID=UPI003515B812
MELVGLLDTWLAARGLSASELTPSVARELLAARREAIPHRVPTLRGLEPLFELQRGLGVVPVDDTTGRVEALIDRYGRFLERDRGLAPFTVVRYQRMARCFLL